MNSTMMTGAFQVPVITNPLRRCALLALTQLSFHLLRPGVSYEFEQQLDEMTNRLFGGEAVLPCQSRSRSLGGTLTYVSPFEIKVGMKTKQQNGRLRATCVKATGYLILSSKDRYNRPG
ncbi:MAG: hypothetical protein R3E79_28730 [Caldilineaceae bacterium]